MRFNRLCALFVLLACGSPTSTPDAIVVGAGGKFDDGSVATFHVCRVIRGEGEGFFRSDTLECEVEEGAPLAPILEVWSGDRFIASMRLEDGPASQAFAADRYPLEVRAQASLYGVSGLEGYELRTTTHIADDGTWAELHGPALPIKLWTVTFETMLGLAQVEFDEQEIAAVVGSLRRGGSDQATATARPTGQLVRPAEPVTLTVAVGTTLTGSAGLGGDELVPFELEAGGTYQVTAEGLRAEVEEPPVGADVVSCETDATTTCRIANPAFVSSATVDGIELPLTGEAVTIEGTEPMEASVQVSSAIALIDAERLGPFTQTVERTGVVELPFDVLEVSHFVGSDVALASFLTDESRVLTFRSAWAGAFQQSGGREALFEGERTYLAVSPGETSLTGELYITSELGMSFEDPTMMLEAGSYVISPAGMVPSSSLESGVELARCWLVEAQLQCSRSAPEVVDTVSLELGLERFDRTLSHAIDRQEPQIITTITPFLPLTVALVGVKSGEEVRVSARLETVEDLAEPLVLITP